MGKIDSNEYGSAAPKLTPEDIDEAAIATITAVNRIETDDKSTKTGKRKAINLEFQETGDKVLWLNKGMIDTLIEKLGDDTDDWVGKQVPIESFTAVFKGQKFPKVGIMAAEEWDNAFEEAGFTSRRKRTVALPVKKVAKRGKR